MTRPPVAVPDDAPGREIALHLRAALDAHPTINGWAELARVAGEREGNVQSLLSGRTAEPRARTLFRVCSALGISMAALLDLSEDADADYLRGYRHGVADAIAQLRKLLGNS